MPVNEAAEGKGGRSMREVFAVNIEIGPSYELQSTASRVCMITFGGSCACDFFKGRVLPGGVDTQRFSSDGTGVLSARYMLEGTDSAGTPTRIFIENTGYPGLNGWQTSPHILTDNRALAWLEAMPLTGTIEGQSGGVIIHFWTEEKANEA